MKFPFLTPFLQRMKPDHADKLDGENQEQANIPDDPNGQIDEPIWDSDETIAMIGSMQVHIIVFLALALVQLRAPIDEEAVVMVSTPPRVRGEDRDDPRDRGERSAPDRGWCRRNG